MRRSALPQLLGNPPSPTNLTVAALGPARVQLGWVDPSTSNTMFSLQRKLTTNGTWATIQTLGADVVSYLDKTAVPSTPYSYRVFANYTGGGYGVSSIVNVTTPAAGPVYTPSNTKASGTAYRKLRVVWDDNNSSEDGYKIERRTGGSWSQLVETLPNTTNYVDATLADEAAAEYRVTAFNYSGTSAASATVSATTWKPYVASVRIGKGGDIATTSASGTVTLSAPFATDKVIALSSPTAGVTVPGNVTVPAGQTSAIFTVSWSNPWAEPTMVTVLATLEGRVARGTYGWLPSATSATPVGLTAQSGLGSIWFDWSVPTSMAFDRPTSSPYANPYMPGPVLEYQETDGSWVALTDPMPGASFHVLQSRSFITQVRVAVYRYPLPWSKVLVGASNVVSVTPSTGTSNATISAPTGTVSGSISITSPSTAGGRAHLYVDGFLAASGGSGSYNRESTSGTFVGLDTGQLSNGTHEVFLVSETPGAFKTSSTTITVQNDLAEVAVMPFVVRNKGDFATVQATLPAGSLSSRLSIIDRAGQTVRTLFTSGDKLEVTWDGRNDAGQVAPDGRYKARYLVQPPAGDDKGSNLGYYWMYKTDDDPVFLAMVMVVMGRVENVDITASMADSIYDGILTYKASINPSFSGAVVSYIDSNQNWEVSAQWWSILRRWLKDSVQYLYVDSHGSAATSNGEQRIPIAALRSLNNKLNTTSESEDSIAVHRLTQSRPSYARYKFIWMDVCSSAGYDASGPKWFMTATPNTLWASAFRMDLWSGAGASLAWNGYSSMNVSKNSWDTIFENQWGRYRKQFFYSLFQGNSVLDSLTYAVQHCGGEDTSIAPYDYHDFPNSRQFKLYNWGEAYLP